MEVEMKATLLENKRENFRGLELKLSGEEREKFPNLPRVFSVGVNGWNDSSRFETTPDIAEAGETQLSNNEASVFLTDIANDLPEFASSLKMLLSTLS
jgi:hypothetical protein